MKVQRREVLPTANGRVQDSISWLPAGRAYTVISVEIAANGDRYLRLFEDDQGDFGLGLCEAQYFETVDESIPSNWVIRLEPKGVIDLSPSSWLTPGFWEDYFDDDPGAIQKLQTELKIILDEASRH